jgi:hypothetical protein
MTKKDKTIKKWEASGLLQGLTSSDPFANIAFGKTLSSELDFTPQEVYDEVKAINRDRKIESVVEDKPFVEMDIKEHPRYNEGVKPMSGPKGQLFYLDFKYGSTQSS